ncbi:hypothetical protein FHY05_004296 [Sphingomonas sp. BK580]|nr:hypothetical protein [Sphingomonas sp. BK580]
MRVNSDQSIRRALTAHDRFGSWQAVREAASESTTRSQANGRIRERPAATSTTQTTRRG